MPDKETLDRAKGDLREGKAPTTAAGEFIREEVHHVREGKHGARSTKQAIAIGLSKARRAGVPLPAPKKGQASERTRKSAQNAIDEGKRGQAPSRRRSSAVRGALKREGHSAASRGALSRQTRQAASRRSATSRSKAARKAAQTKGPQVRSQAAKKAARARSR
jgi:hypothetical protein